MTTNAIPHEKTHYPPPYAWSDRVCSCAGAARGKSYQDHPTNPRAHACIRCGKYFRYVLYRCSICHDLYLQTYTSPYRCVMDSRCPSHMRTEPCEHESCQGFFSNMEISIREEDRHPRQFGSFAGEDFDFDL